METICVECGNELAGVHYGAGDGRGQRFRCESCHIKAGILADNRMDSFTEYQGKAVRTMKQHPVREVAILYFSGAVCGEAGEAFEIVKKHVRDGTPLDKEKLAKELGDTLWYLAAVCELHGLSLADVAQKNLDKLAARYVTGAYSAKDAHRNRD